MQAHLNTDASGNITLYVKGDLDYDNNIPLRKELEVLMKKNPHSKITVDMSGIDFVGSSGIGIFVDTIEVLNKKKDQIRLANVNAEFLQVFKLYNLSCMEAIIQSFETDETENLNQELGNRKRTFQN